MGCDIHTFSEKRENGKWVSLEYSPFDVRDYGLFAFLANVRNYSNIPPISLPRGVPKDSVYYGYLLNELEEGYYHSASWLFVKEMIDYDYKQIIEDRRYTKQVTPKYFDGRATCEKGQGKKMTLEKFLGKGYFEDLSRLKKIEAERIIFCFDN